MPGPSVVLPPSGLPRWDELAGWWLCRYKASTQRTYAVDLPRWTGWCAAHGRASADDGPRTARAAGIARPIGPHALRRAVGTVGINQGIPLRDIQHLLRHSRQETTVASYDVNGDALERHASHQIAGFLAGWAG